MILWNMPPKAKIYEALTCVADGRVRMNEKERRAEIDSSDGSKTYTVEWSPDENHFSSTDNASFWQGYMGYPIIAVLIMLGKLEVSEDAIQELAGIAWNELNQRYRRDYQKAVDSVLAGIQEEFENSEEITLEVNEIFEQIEVLELKRLPRKH